MPELISQGSLSSYPRKSKFSIVSEGQLFHLKFIQKLESLASLVELFYPALT